MSLLRRVKICGATEAGYETKDTSLEDMIFIHK